MKSTLYLFYCMHLHTCTPVHSVYDYSNSKDCTKVDDKPVSGRQPSESGQMDKLSIVWANDEHPAIDVTITYHLFIISAPSNSYCAIYPSSTKCFVNIETSLLGTTINCKTRNGRQIILDTIWPTKKIHFQSAIASNLSYGKHPQTDFTTSTLHFRTALTYLRPHQKGLTFWKIKCITEVITAVRRHLNQL